MSYDYWLECPKCKQRLEEEVLSKRQEAASETNWKKRMNIIKEAESMAEDIPWKIQSIPMDSVSPAEDFGISYIDLTFYADCIKCDFSIRLRHEHYFDRMGREHYPKRPALKWKQEGSRLIASCENDNYVIIKVATVNGILHKLSNGYGFTFTDPDLEKVKLVANRMKHNIDTFTFEEEEDGED